MATDTTPPAASAEPAAPTAKVDDPVTDRWGWLTVTAVTAVLAATWLPRIGLPIGDNHIGRVFGRHALHLTNFRLHGLSGSSFTADWSPYYPGPYAHHPPLQNILDVICGWFVADAAVAVQLGPHVLALLTVPAAAALLRAFGVRWLSTLIAVGLLVTTQLFWVFGPLLPDLAAIIALSAAVVRLRERPDPPRWLVLAACVAALAATLASWPGIALSAALGLWLYAARRWDRVTVAVGASMVAGVTASLLFIVGVSGLDKLTSQTEMRTTGGEFTALGFVLRQGSFALDNFPIWYLVLFPVALAVGLASRRTRLYVAATSLFAAAWVLLLNNGSFIHMFWAYPVLIPGLVGMGVLADRCCDRVAGRRFAFGAAATAVILVAWLAMMSFGPIGRDRFTRPADAGTLVATHSPSPGQRFAWTTLSAPRWLAYHWNLQPRVLTLDAVGALRPDDLIVVRLDRLPGWLPASAASAPVATQGEYALLLGADVRRTTHR